MAWGGWQILSEDGLEHVATHKYKPGAYTPLDNLLNPFWLALVEYLPRWLAPNLVTFSGFIPMAVSFAISWNQSPDFATPMPRWLAVYAGVSLWFYQTFDAMDGKQARRTGSSTPLGQLFDHGCDCLACLSHHSMAAMAFLPGGSRWCAAGLSALQTGFFLAQWQEYYTGVLQTSMGPVGVTETQYGLILLAVLVGIAGPDKASAVASTQVSLPWAAEPLKLGVVAIQGWALFCGVLIVLCVKDTFKSAATSTENIPAAPPGPQRVWRACLDMSPVVGLNVLLFSWDAGMYGRYPRKILFFTGLLFFYFTAQMILFSMAKMRFPAIQKTLVVYAALVVASRLLDQQQGELLGLLLTMASTGVGMFVLLWLVKVIDELKFKLGICVFTITRRKD